MSKAEDHDHQKIILDYIMTHAKNDQRPYLKVNILGQEMLGLLDSGATRTILGGPGWKIISSLYPLKTQSAQTCVVANGATCNSVGEMSLPIQLKDRIRIIEVLVVPDIPQNLILGIDFWSKMEIIPDLYTGEWSFRGENHSSAINLDGIQNLETLLPDQRNSLNRVIEQAFANMGDKLGCTHLVEHKIHTNSPPIRQRYYPLSPALQKIVNEELNDMLKNDIIEPSSSSWASPIVMVRKSDGRWRFCVNYKKLNAVSQVDAYPIPYVSAILDKLRDAKYLTTLDIKSAYWQIPVAQESRHLTAFIVPNRGLFQFKRLPFGLHSAPKTWQRLADQLLCGLEDYAFVYLDDIIICTSTFGKHLEVLEEILKRLREARLTLNREKCVFCRSELRYLGYVVNQFGLLVDPDKVNAVLRIPTPKNVTEVRRVVGLASWYRRFIPSFSTIVSPLTKLTQKNQPFIWDEGCERALNTIKQTLVSAPILACPDFNLPFYVETDASDYGLGAVLTQRHPDGERVVCYLSRALSKQEKRFSTTEKETLAILFSIEKLRPYLEGTKFYVITDHYCLKWLFSIKDPIGRIARWALRLQQYDFEVIHRRGKDHLVPDALSRAVVEVDCVGLSPEKIPIDKWYEKMLQEVQEKPSQFPLWMIENGKLYKRIQRRYPDLESREWLMVVPRGRRQEIIQAHHNPPTCGHLGISKTVSRISENYIWPKMRVDVARYVRNCTTCIATKPEQKPPRGHMLSPQVTATRPWEIVSVDMVGPLPRSTNGHSYILSVMCCFSKFVLLFPLRTATTLNILKWLEDHTILVYGAPKKLIVDNGSQFRSKQFQEAMAQYGIQISWTAYYHPQANPVERVHRVIKTMLSSYVEEDQRRWDRYLPKIAFAIRSAKHDVTGVTPNLLNFGREVIINNSDVNSYSSKEFDSESKQKALTELFENVQKKLKVAYDKAKTTYNLRRRDGTFNLNQKVWRRNYALSDATKHFTSKLAPKFIGPFRIKRIISPWSYELEDYTHKSVGVWHAKDIKAHPPEEDNGE